MVTQLQEQETKKESKRIFTGLDTSRLSSNTQTEYRKPNFSEIDFEPVSTTIETITPSQKVNDKQTDMVIVSEQIANRPTVTNVKLNARGKIIIGVVAICICALIAFMIGNIVTIVNLNNTISSKQQIVASKQQTVTSLQNQSQELIEAVEQNAIENGYTKVDTSNIVYTEAVTKISKSTADIQSNWFDKLCEFFANIF